MGCKSSTYSHSQHIHASTPKRVPSHSLASSRSICFSHPHPQHDTSTVCSLRSSVSNPPKCWSIRSIMFSLFILFISLFFLSLTEDSLPENFVDCKLYFHLFSLFLSPYCDPVSRLGRDRKRRFLSTIFYSHSQHCQRLMSSHSRASPIVMVASLPHPQQVTARFSSFNQGSTLSTDMSPPFSALLRIPSLIALALSLITCLFSQILGFHTSDSHCSAHSCTVHPSFRACSTFDSTFPKCSASSDNRDFTWILNSFFISLFILVFLSLTGNSIAQSQKNASFIFTFLHFFFRVVSL